MDWRIDAKGVTPTPVPTRIACSARKMLLDGDPNGPSTKTFKYVLLPKLLSSTHL